MQTARHPSTEFPCPRGTNAGTLLQPTLGITSTIAAASYVINSLAPVVHWIHPIRYTSLFFYAVGDEQLLAGLSPTWAAVLLGVAVVFAVASAKAFDRLDVH